jgi:hypothetical protein
MECGGSTLSAPKHARKLMMLLVQSTGHASATIQPLISLVILTAREMKQKQLIAMMSNVQVGIANIIINIYEIQMYPNIVNKKNIMNLLLFSKNKKISNL